MRSSCLLAFPVLVVAWTSSAVAADPTWTRFPRPRTVRGSARRPTSPSPGPIATIAGRSSCLERASAPPVVWKDRLYLTSCIEDQSALVVFMPQDGGRERRLAAVVQGQAAREVQGESRRLRDTGHQQRSGVRGMGRRRGARSSWRSIDSRWKEIWRRDLGPFVAEDGFGASPVLVGDVVVVTNDQDEGGTSSVEALDQKTGKTQWSVSP